MSDPMLELAPLVVPIHEPEATIQQRFEAFDQANPWVRQALTDLAMQAKRDGRTRIGMKHLVEVVRWNYGRRTSGTEFRFDNRYTSRFARAIVADHPDLADLFELRRLRAA